MTQQHADDAGPEPGPGSARLAVETWESLFRAQVAIMRRLQSDPVWDGLTLREYDVLFSLTKGPEDGMRLRDLNAYILLSQPSLSRMAVAFTHLTLASTSEVKNSVVDVS